MSINACFHRCVVLWPKTFYYYHESRFTAVSIGGGGGIGFSGGARRPCGCNTPLHHSGGGLEGGFTRAYFQVSNARVTAAALGRTRRAVVADYDVISRVLFTNYYCRDRTRRCPIAIVRRYPANGTRCNNRKKSPGLDAATVNPDGRASSFGTRRVECR